MGIVHYSFEGRTSWSRTFNSLLPDINTFLILQSSAIHIYPISILLTPLPFSVTDRPFPFNSLCLELAIPRRARCYVLVAICHLVALTEDQRYAGCAALFTKQAACLHQLLGRPLLRVLYHDLPAPAFSFYMGFLIYV